MENNQDLIQAQMEYQFWLQIMGDHARFILSSLDPIELDHIQRSQEFINSYDLLLSLSKEELTAELIREISPKALSLTEEFRDFKIQLLTLTLNSNLNFHLPSSFFNEMINGLEEFILVIRSIVNNESANSHSIHLHLLWLTNAILHGAMISASLDIIEKDIIDQSRLYEMQFTDLILKATILKGYLRTSLTSFTPLNRLNEQVEHLIYTFIEFLDHLLDLRIDGKILGSLSPLMVDHMSREQCYYLWKLSLSVGTLQKPECDPFRSRILI